MLERLLGSRLRARVIGWLFTHPDERFYVRQLAALLDEDSTNLSRELARLESLGVLLSERGGRQKYYRANPDSSVFVELKGLATKTAGVVDILRQGLEGFRDQIDSAFVFGSFARQDETAASDIDLVIIGDVDPISLHRAMAQAEAVVRRTINYSLVSREEYAGRREEEAGFLGRVLKGPKLMVLGALDERR
jgi:DNA-binding transcriptional ArsR family regulator